MQHAFRQPLPEAAPAPSLEALGDDARYVRSVLRRNGVSARDAEDLVQEVLLVMWRRRADYDPSRPLRPWLAGIAVKVAATFRKRRLREAIEPMFDAVDGGLDPEQELAAVRTNHLVMKALLGVPEKLRTVLVLYELDDWSMRDVARTLGVPLFTAYSRLRMGRQSLAQSVRRLERNATDRADPPLVRARRAGTG